MSWARRTSILLHASSTYPSQYSELNLRVIPELHKRYGVPVGYSGHETGIASSVAAVALGACMVERHITLERSMWGSDQAASLGPSGITRLVRDIRLVEAVDGDGVKRVFDREARSSRNCAGWVCERSDQGGCARRRRRAD